jgi:filamentous hemagglutinin
VQYAQDKKLPPEQVQADLALMVKGDLPESANIIKAILENNPGSDTVILAEQIHTLTTTKGPDGKEVVNVEANLIAHAQAGKNAVENNWLSDSDITSFVEKYANAKTDEERDQYVTDLKKLDAEKQDKALATAISIRDQKTELKKLKVLQALLDCNKKCQQLVAYSISELEPVANNTELHRNNINKAVLAGVIFGLTVEKPAANNPISRLTKEQQELINRAEFTTTAKGIQNPFPRDLNEKIIWNQIRANPSSAGVPLKGMNKDPRFPKYAGFQKMEAKKKLSNDSTITVHYQYNSMTNKAYDMKITTPQRDVSDPAKVIDSIKDAIK